MVLGIHSLSSIAYTFSVRVRIFALFFFCFTRSLVAVQVFEWKFGDTATHSHVHTHTQTVLTQITSVQAIAIHWLATWLMYTTHSNSNKISIKCTYWADTFLHRNDRLAIFPLYSVFRSSPRKKRRKFLPKINKNVCAVQCAAHWSNTKCIFCINWKRTNEMHGSIIASSSSLLLRVSINMASYGLCVDFILWLKLTNKNNRKYFTCQQMFSCLQLKREISGPAVSKMNLKWANFDSFIWFMFLE